MKRISKAPEVLNIGSKLRPVMIRRGVAPQPNEIKRNRTRGTYHESYFLNYFKVYFALFLLCINASQI